MSRERKKVSEPDGEEGSPTSVARTIAAANGISSIIGTLDASLTGKKSAKEIAALKSRDDEVQLTTYEVTGGNFTCESVHEIQLALSTGTLQALVLRNLQMEVTVVNCLQATLSPVTGTLSSLTLSNCGLDDGIALTLSSAMVQPESVLVSLDLSNNYITNTGAVALASNLPSSKLVTLYLSSNHLTPEGVAAFAKGLQHAPHLQNLGLGDIEHLLPVTIFQQFLSALENNFTLKTLTLGSEIMDGSTGDNGEMLFKDMDVNLAYFWQAPVYIAATDRMRFLLRLNRVFLVELLQTNQCDIAALRRLMDSMPAKHEVEAVYRVLKIKPEFLVLLCKAQTA